MEKPSEGFPRITSKVPKDYVPLMKLVELPDEEKKVSGQHFKLVWIGGEEEESDLSNKSESEPEWSDGDIQLPVENTEKPKAIESEPVSVTDEPQVDIKEPLKKSPNKRYTRRPKNKNRNKNRSKNRRSNNYNSPKRSFNTSTKGYNYETVASSSIMEKRIYNNYNSNVSFGTSSNLERSFQPISNSSNDIEPWESPPVLLNTIPNYQYSNYVIHPYVSAVGHVGHLPAISRKSVGILGDSPYSHCAANFQPNSPNGNFMYGANYWNVDQYRHSVNYQGHNQTYFQRRKCWNKYKKKQIRARYKNAKKHQNTSGH